MQVRGVRTLNVDLVSFDQEFKKSNNTKKTSMNDKKIILLKLVEENCHSKGKIIHLTAV